MKKIDSGDSFEPKMIPIENLRACAYCNDYVKLDPIVLTLNEAKEEVVYTYNCGSCFNQNKITFRLHKVEVFEVPPHFKVQHHVDFFAFHSYSVSLKICFCIGLWNQ